MFGFEMVRRHMSNNVVMLISMFVLSTLLTASTPTVTPEQADQFLRAQDWKNAAAAYDQLAQANPTNGRFWLRLGVSHIKLREYKAALPALDHAEQLGIFPDRTRFEMAIAYAGLNDRDAAV